MICDVGLKHVVCWGTDDVWWQHVPVYKCSVEEAVLVGVAVRPRPHVPPLVLLPCHSLLFLHVGWYLNAEQV